MLAQFFFQRANGILEVMTRLSYVDLFSLRWQLPINASYSSNEKKRRQVYRGEVHGQLPFETKGMDDPVPSLDFSHGGSTELPYSLERVDVEGCYFSVLFQSMRTLTDGIALLDLMTMFSDLERFARESPYPSALAAVKEARTALEKLITRMDTLESGFDRIAERSCEFPCIERSSTSLLTSCGVEVLSSSRFLEHRRRSTFRFCDAFG